MALTSEFIEAVNNKNLLRVRIMLKDSLLVDKSFRQFDEMRQYAERWNVNFWMEMTEELEIQPRESWDVELMDLELASLVNDFTRKRLAYCQDIIRSVYGFNPAPTRQGTRPGQPSKQGGLKSWLIPPGDRARGMGSRNQSDYEEILRSVSQMNRILRDNKSEDGRRWTFKDINDIQAAAKRIDAACGNIKRRN